MKGKDNTNRGKPLKLAIEYLILIASAIAPMIFLHLFWPTARQDLKLLLNEITLVQVGTVIGNSILAITTGSVLFWILQRCGFPTHNRISIALTIITGLGIYLVGGFYAYNMGIHSQKSKTDSTIQALGSWARVSAEFANHMYMKRNKPINEALNEFKRAISPVQQMQSPSPTPHRKD